MAEPLPIQVRPIYSGADSAPRLRGPVEPYFAVHSGGVGERVIKNPEKGPQVVLDFSSDQPILFIRKSQLRGRQIVIAEYLVH